MSSKNDCFILLGPPNSGKTTLFNWITGYKRQIVNYPGSTADLALGEVLQEKWTIAKDKPTTVIDTPGFYGFFSSSTEGDITKKVLKENLKNNTLKAVILVLDSTRLKRQLPLLFQLKSANLPVILALTMYDIQKKESGLNIDLLSQLLKVPVCPIEGLLGGGVQTLLQKTYTYFKSSSSPPAPPVLPSPNAVDMKHKNHALTSNWKSNKMSRNKSWSEKTQSHYLKKASKIVDKVLIKKEEKKLIGQKTKLIDSFLLHPVFGFAFLSLILFAFFSSLFWLAQPVMNLVDKGVGYGVDWLLNIKGPFSLMDFLANGVLTGFGSFLIFIPQIFILFLGLYLLEDSGYMARAVSLLDGPFSRIGLNGKSLFPFLSGYACAIPAILSARAISSKRERWITIFVLPFMTCSARLPVYALLLAFLFYGDSAWKPGLWMAFLYFLSLFLSVGMAGLLSLFIPKDKKSSFFIELPLYRCPVLKSVFAVSWSRTKHFISKAGPVIFIFSLIMWGLTNYPQEGKKYENQVIKSGASANEVETSISKSMASGSKAVSSAFSLDEESNRISNSYAGQFGQWIEPLFEKMGGDWRVGISLLSAFVAREVFVSVLAVTLKNTNNQAHPIKDPGSPQSLEKEGLVHVMKQAKRADGQPLFSSAGIVALLVFFIFSLQCLSTTAVVYKETNSWKWAGAQLVGFNVVAYALATLTYHLCY